MTRRESDSKMRWFLNDDAKSPSGRTKDVSDDIWGGSDVVCMAANFQNQIIYIVQHFDGSVTACSCRKFIPTMVTRTHHVVVSATEHPVSIQELLEDGIEAKIDSPESPPLML